MQPLRGANVTVKWSSGLKEGSAVLVKYSTSLVIIAVAVAVAVAVLVTVAGRSRSRRSRSQRHRNIPTRSIGSTSLVVYRWTGRCIV
jgi:hypothetical protein